jgi:hypothetical protein
MMNNHKRNGRVTKFPSRHSDTTVTITLVFAPVTDEGLELALLTAL